MLQPEPPWAVGWGTTPTVSSTSMPSRHFLCMEGLSLISNISLMYPNDLSSEEMHLPPPNMERAWGQLLVVIVLVCDHPARNVFFWVQKLGFSYKGRTEWIQEAQLY